MLAKLILPSNLEFKSPTITTYHPLLRDGSRHCAGETLLLSHRLREDIDGVYLDELRSLQNSLCGSELGLLTNHRWQQSITLLPQSLTLYLVDLYSQSVRSDDNNF
jgi:hypothetical protein